MNTQLSQPATAMLNRIKTAADKMITIPNGRAGMNTARELTDSGLCHLRWDIMKVVLS